MLAGNATDLLVPPRRAPDSIEYMLYVRVEKDRERCRSGKHSRNMPDLLPLPLPHLPLLKDGVLRTLSVKEARALGPSDRGARVGYLL